MDKKVFNSPYKDFALKAAKELMYKKKCINKIKKAKSDSEIQRIMTSARIESFEY